MSGMEEQPIVENEGHEDLAPKQDTYGLGQVSSRRKVAAPELPYHPRNPQKYHPRIGLVACGGIVAQHLAAYRKAGYDVAVLCDLDIDKAKQRRDEFYPEAEVTDTASEVFARDDIEVVDIAAHPAQRAPLVEAALQAGKHVLSQKPFVLDLETGEKLVALAEKNNLKLAVNQNGRWAPHFSYMRHAVAAGLLGDISSVNFSVHWDHEWIKSTPFDTIHHIVLYDFAIHWFDIALQLLGNRTPTRVTASVQRSPFQEANSPLLAQAIVDVEGAQATFSFNGSTRFGSIDRTDVVGSKGALRAYGPSLDSQSLELYTEAGRAEVPLQGCWFPDGFWGTMAELLCAIEDNREPSNSARNNLKSLELCFAACASADTGQPQVPGEIRQVPASCMART